MIRVENLVKEYYLKDNVLRAVDDISFNVSKGEVFGFIGLSGAGKSTLVRCLNKLEEKTSGDIYIDNTDISILNEKELLEIRRSIGMIFQNFNLFKQRTVFENIAYPLELIGISKNEIRERVNEILDFVGLTDKINSYPRELSGGQKQRVAIARALSTRPKILLSDESTSALDPKNTDQILKLLKDSVKAFDMTVIMITHQMEVAKNICDRIAVLDKGRIIETGTVEEVFNNPKTEMTRSLIRALPDEAEDIILDRNSFKGTLLHLNFGPSTVKLPIINNLIKNSNVVVNILSGNISTISSKSTSGYLTVELVGDKEEIDKEIRNLENQNVGVERLWLIVI